jgi:MarR family transcriptional repressor of mepA
MALDDLHLGQVFVLIELWREDGLKQIEIATRLNVAAPTINKSLKGLEEINLVTMRQAGKDGRVRKVFLTQAGLDIREKVERRWIDIESKCLVGFRDPERVNLDDLLRRLLAAFTDREFKDDE